MTSSLSWWCHLTIANCWLVSWRDESHHMPFWPYHLLMMSLSHQTGQNLQWLVETRMWCAIFAFFEPYCEWVNPCKNTLCIEGQQYFHPSIQPKKLMCIYYISMSWLVLSKIKWRKACITIKALCGNEKKQTLTACFSCPRPQWQIYAPCHGHWTHTGGRSPGWSWCWWG